MDISKLQSKKHSFVFLVRYHTLVRKWMNTLIDDELKV